ncbi:MAG: hypothetical protein EXS28_08420 [Pedosphaera sp.]|nr:hypothetical protein [Pedosphaera sp.]
MKLIALLLAVMLWFIIKLSAELRYSNTEPVQNPTQPFRPQPRPDVNATQPAPSPQPDEQEP